MLFQEEHIKAIRNRQKTQTRRDWAPEYNRPRVGSIQMAVTEMFTPDEKCDCYIRICDRWQEPLGKITEEEADAEGGYTVDEFRSLWRQLHGEWSPSQVVDVIEFEYVGRTRPSEECETQ